MVDKLVYSPNMSSEKKYRTVDYPQWQGDLAKLMTAHGDLPFKIGDLLNEGQEVFGERIQQYLPEGVGYSQTLMNYMRVARLFPEHLRNFPGLSISHYTRLAQIRDADMRRRATEAASDRRFNTKQCQELATKLNKRSPQPTDNIFKNETYKGGLNLKNENGNH